MKLALACVSFVATDRAWIWRATLLEQSFRRETYRGLRLSVITRF